MICPGPLGPGTWGQESEKSGLLLHVSPTWSMIGCMLFLDPCARVPGSDSLNRKGTMESLWILRLEKLNSEGIFLGQRFFIPGLRPSQLVCTMDLPRQGLSTGFGKLCLPSVACCGSLFPE